MIGALINLIVWLLVVGILYLLVVWVLDSIPIPDPANRIIKLVLVVVIALIVILMLLNLVGISTGSFNVPKVTLQ
jgi:glucan phosphoethanolaminetransferase (alkaline phosphatase superfamily)